MNAPAAAPLASALYVGTVRHRRFAPRAHAFRYRLFMVYLDLGELDRVFAGRWLWSARRRALAWFSRADHFGDPARPLDACVRELVERETGRRPAGPVRLLTHLRYAGHCFNPISIYYCFDAAGERVEALVAEVTNIPWGERHCYVLDPGGRPLARAPQRFAKRLHVSPFLPMDLDYAWRCHEPGARLGVHMDVHRGADKLFDATLNLVREPIGTRSLARALLRFPLMTLTVVAAIHWQALRLWLKRVPLFDHPARPTPVEEPPR